MSQTRNEQLEAFLNFEQNLSDEPSTSRRYLTPYRRPERLPNNENDDKEETLNQDLKDIKQKVLALPNQMGLRFSPLHTLVKTQHYESKKYSTELLNNTVEIAKLQYTTLNEITKSFSVILKAINAYAINSEKLAKRIRILLFLSLLIIVLLVILIFLAIFLPN